MGVTVEQSPRRSDATRAAILEAARHRFAADGYRKATIRAIAADAGIDPSMVMRYYGNKDGLFDAALDIDLELPDLSAEKRDSLGAQIADRFFELWEQPPTSEILLTLMRSALSDEMVVERTQRIFAEQLMPAVLRFGDPFDAPRRAGLIATQILGLALCRYVLRLPPVVALTREQIVADIGPTIQRYLTLGTD
ncbi:TetR family transcriptional regulator [Nocardia seriolae]|uniref:TetR family transcriptional regulator n=1 Tax=Nocardia seriolae TaxID=37332 RepID=A0ABC9YY58_9NOCA|nr:TetR family transcriptional regulator [Nocardia seriolae]BEK94300.1 TetR family transcriptional regulator [Nocardia seriolae]GAM48460.1 TetR family transcriptional regulator [Nocardia seriolae]GAP30374.1 TetR family transcriptional regulator [Nocardia seriolae]GEM25947.1 TetR family transcriptional regulator [Nocardia seriolae NBRC 15557]